MNHAVLQAAIHYVNALGGPRKTELERLKRLQQTVSDYEAHQGFSDSASNRSISSRSMRSASAL